MHSSKTILACAALAIVQVAAAIGFVPARTSAQSEQLVAVLVGEKSREACEVQDRRSDDRNSWGEQTIEGPWVPCEGGLVTGVITTEEEAAQTVARAEATTTSENVRVIELTGDPEADEATIQAETVSLHHALTPLITGQAAENQLGFMAPGALENLPLGNQPPSASVLAANCKDGKVGQWRRREVRWYSPGAHTTAVANVYYKRISCARWRLTDVEMTLTRPPSHDRVWFRNLYYTKAWLGNGYGDKEAGKQCWRLRETEWTNFEPNWEIPATGSLKIEAVDANPSTPGTVPSCWSGAGTSFTSKWIFLPGGKK